MQRKCVENFRTWIKERMRTNKFTNFEKCFLQFLSIVNSCFYESRFSEMKSLFPKFLSVLKAKYQVAFSKIVGTGGSNVCVSCVIIVITCAASFSNVSIVM